MSHTRRLELALAFMATREAPETAAGCRALCRALDGVPVEWVAEAFLVDILSLRIPGHPARLVRH